MFGKSVEVSGLVNANVRVPADMIQGLSVLLAISTLQSVHPSAWCVITSLVNVSCGSRDCLIVDIEEKCLYPSFLLLLIAH